MGNLPQIKSNKLVDFLLKQGWKQIRQKGSHVILYHPDRPETPLIVPVHYGHNIKKGLLHRLVRVAGWTDDEFIELYRKS